jgi:hypothetical protein
MGTRAMPQFIKRVFQGVSRVGSRKVSRSNVDSEITRQRYAHQAMNQLIDNAGVSLTDELERRMNQYISDNREF